MSIITALEKLCNLCGKTNKVFYTNLKQCGPCRSKLWRKNNPEKCQLYSKNRKMTLEQKIQFSAYKKRWKLKTQYNMTEGELQEMELRQNFKCIICFENPEKLHVDHNHATNKVRGLLCGKCNRGLGMFKDSIEHLSSAINYLRTAKEI